MNFASIRNTVASKADALRTKAAARTRAAANDIASMDDTQLCVVASTVAAVGVIMVGTAIEQCVNALSS